MIAKEKGVKVSELSKDPDAPAEAKAKATKKADAKKTTAKE